MATDDVNEKLSEQTEVTKLLNETLKSMIDLLGEGSDGFGNLSRQINETIKDKSSLIDEEIRAQKEAKKLLEYMEKEIESVESLGSAYNLAQKYIKQLSKEHASLRNAMAAASGAMKGFQVGFNALKAIGGGVFDVLKSVTGAIVDFSMAILSAPFKMLEGLIGLAKQGMGSTELATALENVRKTFGDIDSGLGKNIVDMGRAMTQGMVAPGLRATQVFGFLHEAIEAINKVASAAPEAFQKLSDQFKGEGSRNILGMSKGLGIAEEDLTKLMGVSISTGQSMISMETEMTKYAKGMSRQFGMDSKLISRDMSKAMTNVKYFANSTIKEISEAVVYTQKLGLSLEKVTGIMDAFSTFDKAAENVSRLSQAFGVNIDTMKLMKAKNPAEQIDLLKKSFQEAGKSVESMDRYELQLLASTLNLDEATVKQMLSSKNQGESLDKVKSASGKLQHQTMSTAEAMQSLSKDIDRLVKAGQVPESNSLWGMFGEGFLQGISRTKEFQLLIQNLRKDMWIVTQSGRELGVAFLESFPGFKEIISGLTKVFDPEGIKKLFKSFNGAFTDFFKDLGSGTATVEKLMDKLQKIFTDYAKGAAGEEFLGGLSKFWEATKRIIATGIDWVSDKLRDGLNFMVDLLKDDGRQKKMVSAAEQQLSPIITAFKGAWDKIKGPLKEIFTELLSKMGDMLWELFKDNWGKIALIQLTPVFVGGLGNMFMKAAERRLLEGTLKPILSQMAGNISTMTAHQISGGLSTGINQGITEGFSSAGGVSAGSIGSFLGPAAAIAAAAGALALAYNQAKSFMDENADLIEKWRTGKKEPDQVAEQQHENLKGELRKTKSDQEALDKLSAGLTEKYNPKNQPGLLDIAKIELLNGFKAWSELKTSGRKADEILAANAAVEADRRYDLITDAIKLLPGILKKAVDREKVNLESVTNELSAADQSVLMSLQDAWSKGEKIQYTVGDLQTGVKIDGKDFKITDPAVIRAFLAKQNVLMLENLSPEKLAKFAKEQEKVAADAAQSKLAEEGKKLMQETIDSIGVTTMDNVEERFKKIKEIGAKVFGKEADINAEIKKIRDTIAKIDFTIIDPDTSQKFNVALASIDHISSLLNKIKSSVVLVDDLSKALLTFGDSSVPGSPTNKFVVGMGIFSHGLSDIITMFRGGELQNGQKIENGFSISTGSLREAQRVSDELEVLFGYTGFISKYITTFSDGAAKMNEKALTAEKDMKSLSESISRLKSSALLIASSEAITQGVKTLTTGMSELNKGLDELLATPLTKDVTVKFGKVANAIGIKNAQYQLAQIKNMTIMLNMNVTLDAASLEKELVVKRGSGIIRVALDDLGKENDLRMDGATGKMVESNNVGTE